MPPKGVSFADAINSINTTCPEHRFTTENEKKKNRCAGIGRQFPLRTEWFYNRASSNLVTYICKK